jgi:hypothetical protein
VLQYFFTTLRGTKHTRTKKKRHLQAAQCRSVRGRARITRRMHKSCNGEQSCSCCALGCGYSNRVIINPWTRHLIQARGPIQERARNMCAQYTPYYWPDQIIACTTTATGRWLAASRPGPRHVPARTWRRACASRGPTRAEEPACGRPRRVVAPRRREAGEARQPAHELGEEEASHTHVAVLVLLLRVVGLVAA